MTKNALVDVAGQLERCYISRLFRGIGTTEAVPTEPSLSKVSVLKLLLMAPLILRDLAAWPTGRICSGNRCG